MGALLMIIGALIFALEMKSAKPANFFEKSEVIYRLGLGIVLIVFGLYIILCILE